MSKNNETQNSYLEYTNFILKFGKYFGFKLFTTTDTKYGRIWNILHCLPALFTHTYLSFMIIKSWNDTHYSNKTTIASILDRLFFLALSVSLILRHLLLLKNGKIFKELIHKTDYINQKFIKNEIVRRNSLRKFLLLNLFITLGQAISNQMSFSSTASIRLNQFLFDILTKQYSLWLLYIISLISTEIYSQFKFANKEIRKINGQKCDLNNMITVEKTYEMINMLHRNTFIFSEIFTIPLVSNIVTYMGLAMICERFLVVSALEMRIIQSNYRKALLWSYIIFGYFFVWYIINNFMKITNEVCIVCN